MIVALVITVPYCFAVTDAGSLLQQINREQQAAPSKLPSVPKSEAQKQDTPVPNGAVVTVKQFVFEGNTLLSSDLLAQALVSYLNHPIDFRKLQEAADVVANLYREAGWIVQTLIPEQDSANGVIKLAIVEAKFGGVVNAAKEPSLVDLPVVLGFFENQIPVGQFLNADDLDRALLLADDLPGVAVSGTLQEGNQEGQTQLVLKMEDEPQYVGDATLDNTGARTTGVNRALVNLYANSPFGLGDLFTVSTIFSAGTDYSRISETFPVGSDGWRVGGSFSHLFYRLITTDFASTQPIGTANTGGLEASYPIIRSRQKNLTFTSNLDEKRFNNQSSGQLISLYKTAALSLGLSGNLFDDFEGGGANSASLTVVQGHVYDNHVATRPDSYTKFKYSFSRQQVIDDDVTFYVAISGQRASHNLDSSENFSLGGMTGVRAYPTGEGSGNEGILLNCELRFKLDRGFALTAFYDHGQISLVKAPTGNGLNEYVLQGAGLGLQWQSGNFPTLKATWSRRMGDNPNPTSLGFDQDGWYKKDRVWLSASIPF